MKPGWSTLIVVMLAGCRAPQATVDPFVGYGPRVIPPPGTGTIGAAPGYYPAGTYPPGAVAAPPQVYPPPTGYVPPQAYVAPGTYPIVPGTFLPAAPVTYQGPPPTPPVGWGTEASWQSGQPGQPQQLPGSNLANVQDSASNYERMGQPELSDSEGLVWRTPAARGGDVRPATVEFPTAIPAGVRPELAPVPQPGTLPSSPYIPPIRPAVVRPTSYPPTSSIAPAGWSDPCCQEVAGPVTPIPVESFARQPLSADVRVSAPQSSADNRWQPRR